jgi:hypothetical protein
MSVLIKDVNKTVNPGKLVVTELGDEVLVEWGITNPAAYVNRAKLLGKIATELHVAIYEVGAGAVLVDADAASDDYEYHITVDIAAVGYHE